MQYQTRGWRCCRARENISSYKVNTAFKIIGRVVKILPLVFKEFIKQETAGKIDNISSRNHRSIFTRKFRIKEKLEIQLKLGFRGSFRLE